MEDYDSAAAEGPRLVLMKTFGAQPDPRCFEAIGLHARKRTLLSLDLHKYCRGEQGSPSGPLA